MTPHPAPVACTRCPQLFLPPTDQPGAWIECPACGARDTLAAFRAVPAPLEPAPEPPRAFRRAFVSFAFIAAAALILAGAGWFLQKNKPGEAGPAPAPPAAFSPEETRAFSAAYEVAARALSSADVAAARPFLLQAGSPLLDRYHARHPWPAINLARWTAGDFLKTTAPRYLRLTAETDRGQKLPLHLQETEHGWKLDWEALVNAPQFEWEEFCRNLPATPQRLRVRMWRGSVADDYLREARSTASEVIAARLSGPQPGESLLALVPKNSEIGQALQRDLTWEVPRRYVAEIRAVDPKALPPRVEITRLEHEGWSGDVPSPAPPSQPSATRE